MTKTKLSLLRFSTLEGYSKAAAITDPNEKGYIADGTFFVIVETKQLGVRKGTLDILTPSGDIDWQGESLKEALNKFEEKIISASDHAEQALNASNEVRNVIEQYSTGVDYLNLASEIETLKNKIVILSEEDFENKEGLDPTKIYYIYEND